MYDNIEGVLKQGVSLAFLGANAIYWRVRLEEERRVLVCYKENYEDDPDKDRGKTTWWRALGRPEQQLIGQMYVTYFKDPNYPMIFLNTSTWPFANTGLKNGDRIDGIVGYECDHVWEDLPYPQGLIILAKSPVQGGEDKTFNTDCHVTLYTAPSGAKVFAAGTCSWSWGLEDLEFKFLDGWFASHKVASPALQQFTINVLNELLLAGGRVQIADVSAGQGNVKNLYWENWGESPWLNGWCDSGNIQLVGDFMGKGYDQVLFINRNGSGGRVMIADFSGGHGNVQILYWEDWGESKWLDGWHDLNDLQFVGDFMRKGHDQVLFINRADTGARMMIADFSGGRGNVQVLFWEDRNDAPWPNGWYNSDNIQLVGDFMAQGHEQMLFIKSTTT